MVDRIFDAHDTSASAEDVRVLVALLQCKEVKVNSVARFIIVFNSHSTVKAFIKVWSLSDAQEELLMYAAHKYKGADAAEANWKAWRTQNRVRVMEEPSASTREGAWQPDNPAQATKTRRLEASVRHHAVGDVGKTPPTLSIVSTPKVRTLQETQARERRIVAGLCVQPFIVLDP